MHGRLHASSDPQLDDRCNTYRDLRNTSNFVSKSRSPVWANRTLLLLAVLVDMSLQQCQIELEVQLESMTVQQKYQQLMWGPIYTVFSRGKHRHDHTHKATHWDLLVIALFVIAFPPGTRACSGPWSTLGPRRTSLREVQDPPGGHQRRASRLWDRRPIRLRVGHR